jgi:hypothetical protein
MTLNNVRKQSAREHSKYCAQQLAANIMIKENTKQVLGGQMQRRYIS